MTMESRRKIALEAIGDPSKEQPYWLCCGSLDPSHSDDRAQSCREANLGHKKRCRFGTRTEHGKWELSLQQETTKGEKQ